MLTMGLYMHVASERIADVVGRLPAIDARCVPRQRTTGTYHALGTAALFSMRAAGALHDDTPQAAPLDEAETPESSSDNCGFAMAEAGLEPARKLPSTGF